MNSELKSEILGLIQQNLIQQYESEFKKSDLNDFSDVALRIDAGILNIINQSLSENIKLLFPNNKLEISSNKNFVINDSEYSIVSNNNFLVKSNLEIGIINSDFSDLNTTLADKKFELNQCGRYSLVMFSVPDLFLNKIDFEFAISIIKTIIFTSNKWIEQKASIIIGENYAISQNLYQYLRTIFLNEKFVDNIWLYIASGDDGFYFLDKKQIDKALNLFSPLSKKSGLPALTILSEILNRKLKFSDTASDIVTKNNKTQDFKVKKLDYSKDNAIFVEAEILFYGEEAVTGVPIEVSGKYKLVAGIPVSHRLNIEPILKIHRSELKNRFKATFSKVEKLKKLITNIKIEVNYGKLGEFVGGFTKAFKE